MLNNPCAAEGATEPGNATGARVTDLEMTRLCAEAMFHNAPIHIMRDEGQDSVVVSTLDWGGLYDPLNDDAQAMALVKRFKPYIGHVGDKLTAFIHAREPIRPHESLNRAIVECVAKMQAAKVPA